MKKKPTRTERRINVVLSVEMYEQFKVLAKEEDRSLTNFASVLIRRYIKETWNKKQNNTEGQ